MSTKPGKVHTSGELIRLILSEAYWPLFAEHFPASKTIVQTKLEEIGNVRNAMAHFRPLKTDDVQVVKQNANQVLSGVEKLLVSVVDCNDTVPTNSPDAWYNELQVLTGPYVHLEFHQSVDEKWVSIGLKYACPLLAEPFESATYRSYRVLAVQTPQLLRASAEILRNVVFTSEDIPYLQMPPKGPPAFSKTVRFLFSRKTLSEKHKELKQEFEEILKRITIETDLIKEDNLARGEFVQSVYGTANRDSQDKQWIVDTSGLNSPTREDDEPEYWARHPFIGSHFVSHTELFPWMPVNVSQFTFPY